MAEPGCLSDLKRVGFNLFNTANNHAMDYGHKGLLATIKNLMNLDIPFAGTGINLAEACKPVFFESSNGRIALLGVTSSFHDSYAAGPQNQDMHGRPGVSPLKHRTIYELKKVIMKCY
ncbi:CapA family protein [Bacteroides thetaiotaomicron]|nr:CapA family protein [Bacteroides thetaiotaomicron]